ncbi:PAS domain-containing protein [Paracoccus methylarcula]|uniref:PAS domain-containing protein n=1 Tax=Paracoccus methylarcula TaxID=72022 RepID=A0A3R7P3K1_9RHOB|nr:PAS domain-containing protein [Paracoccus methylarcula]RNF33771.1 PAS domain-containing protein [Paracoccus methylarcula]
MEKQTNRYRITQTGNILYIVDSKRPSAGCIMAEMREYWQGLRRNGSVPLRADVSADAISRVLDYAFLVERLAPGMARFRLVGQHLVDLMGMELRGMPLCSLINRVSRKRVSEVTETVFRAPQIAEMQLSSQSVPGSSGIRGNMLLLPLKSDLDDVTRALGCLVSQGTVGVRPQRFDLDGTKFTPVIPGGEILQPSFPADPDPP